MDKPVFPLIVIYDSSHVDLIPEEENFKKVPASDLLLDEDYSELYDAQGYVWHYRLIAKAFKNTFWNRLLAYTFYNPKYKTKPVWERIREYHIEDLKDRLKECVDADDDIITQYEDAEIIKREINICFSFTDVVDVLNKYVFNVRLDEILEEQRKREEARS